MECANRLAAEKNLPVIELKYQKGILFDNKQIIVEVGAGPAEFLGYIHYADYVLTNSFHAMAFSIIYQKKFLTFGHSTRNARLEMYWNNALWRKEWSEAGRSRTI